MPEMYASGFFLTLGSNRFSFEVVERIWDIFFFEGWKILLRLLVGLFKHYKDKVIKLSCAELIPFIHEQAAAMDVNTALKIALGVKLRSHTIKQLVEQYETTMLTDKEKNLITKQREMRSKLLQSRESRKLSETPQQQAQGIPIKKQTSLALIGVKSVNGSEDDEPSEKKNNSVETTTLLEYEFNDRYLY